MGGFSDDEIKSRNFSMLGSSGWFVVGGEGKRGVAAESEPESPPLYIQFNAAIRGHEAQGWRVMGSCRSGTGDTGRTS